MITIDQIIRTKRKSIALIIEHDGRLVVRAPMSVSNARIQALVKKKADWIQEKRALVSSIYPPTTLKEYVNGESFWFLGKPYPLKIVESALNALALDDFFCLDRSALPHAQAVFVNWYKRQAHLVISERVAWYAAKSRIDYQQVKITSARSRWGSCSSKGNLCFTWRLVMAPETVIDYVVVHELVHILEKNHGKAYWAKVQAIMPDYKQRKEWLDINGHLLRI